MGLESIQNRYLDGRPDYELWSGDSFEIDHEVMKMLKEAYRKQRNFFQNTEKSLDKIAAFLIEKETNHRKRHS